MANEKNDEVSILLRQVIDGQAALFLKIDKTNETVSTMARNVAVLQEKESDDRETIKRIGAEMRTCKTGCEGEIKVITRDQRENKDRILKLEAKSGQRGQVLQWVLNLFTSGLLIIAAWKIKG